MKNTTSHEPVAHQLITEQIRVAVADLQKASEWWQETAEIKQRLGIEDAVFTKMFAKKFEKVTKLLQETTESMGRLCGKNKVVAKKHEAFIEWLQETTEIMTQPCDKNEAGIKKCEAFIKQLQKAKEITTQLNIKDETVTKNTTKKLTQTIAAITPDGANGTALMADSLVEVIKMPLSSRQN